MLRAVSATNRPNAAALRPSGSPARRSSSVVVAAAQRSNDEAPITKRCVFESFSFRISIRYPEIFRKTTTLVA